MSLGPEHVEAVKAAADKIHAAAVLLSTAPTAPPAGGVHQIVMQSPDSGERAVHKTEKIAIGLACLLLGLSIGGWSLVSRMADDARDLRREQQRTADYQAMLWQRYPELRPENLKPKEDKKP